MTYFEEAMFFFIIIVFRCCHSHFTNSCPEPSLREKRIKTYCNSTNKAYICVKDLNKENYIEICQNQPELYQRGYKAVWRGNLDSRKCDPMRYQPIIFNTDYGSDCILKSSKCADEGQTIVESSSSVKDIKCGCDYAKGYAFVKQTNNPCFCVPSEEDCTCYRKKCPQFHTLSADYSCKREGDDNDNLVCSSYSQRRVVEDIEPAINNSKLLLVIEEITGHYVDSRCRFDSCTALFTAVTLMIGIVIQFCLVLLFVTTGKIFILIDNYKIKICFKKNSNSDDGKGPIFTKHVNSNEASKVVRKFEMLCWMDSTVDRNPKIAVIGRTNISETIQSLLGVDCLQHFNEVNESNKPDAVVFALECGCLPVDEFMKFLQCLQSFENAVNFTVVFVSNDEVNVSECLDKVPELKYAVKKSEIRCFSYCKTYTHDTGETKNLQYSKDMKLKLLKAINYCRLNDPQQCDTSHNTEQLLVVQNGVANGNPPQIDIELRDDLV